MKLPHGNKPLSHASAGEALDGDQSHVLDVQAEERFYDVPPAEVPLGRVSMTLRRAPAVVGGGGGSGYPMLPPKDGGAEVVLPRVLRIREVVTLTGLARSAIYRLEAKGCFPRRIKLSDRAVGWLADEVSEWLRTRARVRTHRCR